MQVKNICVSLGHAFGEIDFGFQPEWVEFRLDLIPNLDRLSDAEVIDWVKSVVHQHGLRRIILTFRSRGEGNREYDSRRVSILEQLAGEIYCCGSLKEWGGSLKECCWDIDGIDSGISSLSFKDGGCQILNSLHLPRALPTTQLLAALDSMSGNGEALDQYPLIGSFHDWKIVIPPYDEHQHLLLPYIYAEYSPFIFFFGGADGADSRIQAVECGAPFLYAYHEQPTAAGQPCARELYEELRK